MSVLPLDALPSPMPASTADPYPAGPHLDPANPAGGLAVETIAEVSADTGLRERPFAVQIEPSQIAAEHVRTLRLARGSASFHDVMLPHYSPPNRSTTRRRAAWICRCECSNAAWAVAATLTVDRCCEQTSAPTRSWSRSMSKDRRSCRTLPGLSGRTLSWCWFGRRRARPRLRCRRPAGRKGARTAAPAACDKNDVLRKDKSIFCRCDTRQHEPEQTRTQTPEDRRRVS